MKLKGEMYFGQAMWFRCPPSLVDMSTKRGTSMLSAALSIIG